MLHPPAVPPAHRAEIARRIRLRDLDMIQRAGAGHLGSELSCTDILVSLYFGELSYDASNPQAPDRDRFVLSKGHAAGVLYVMLAEAGFITPDTLDTFLAPESPLSGHPDRRKVPGVETNTGPLGHGLPVAVGMAKSAKMQAASWRTYVLTGDGELQEGSNWEAIMAAAQFELDNLVAIVDHNTLQQGARLADTNDVAPIAEKFRAFRWHTIEVDGHDFDALAAAYAEARATKGRPTCIVARTVKGRGISFAEDQVSWHHRVPTEAEYLQARRELEGGAS